MSWKNGFIKAFLWLLNPEATRPRPGKKLERFLIVTTTGLGDTLWGTPAIRSLRQTYPESNICVLTSEIGYQVLQHNKHIDELFVLGASTLWSLLRFFPSLKKRKWNAVLIFHSSQRIILPFCALLEPSIIIGTEGAHKDLDFLLTQSLPAKKQHEIERRLAMVQAVGAYVSEMNLEMVTRKEEEQAACAFLAGHGIAEHIPLVCLHPGAKNRFKQWPAASFIEVGKRLVQHTGCQIIVSGDQSEALLVMEIASQIPGAIPVAGELNIATFTALLKKMRLFITNDTGPMHLAFAVQTPTVALFGPTDPALCGPFEASQVKVLAVSKTCIPCLKKKCAQPFCLMQIGPDQVYDAALELFIPK